MTNNQNAIYQLLRLINHNQGDFALILAHCDYSSLREQLIKQLQQQNSFDIAQICLNQEQNKLYTTIAQELGEQQPDALVVTGLEQVSSLDDILTASNQIREEFRRFGFPVVLWVTERVLQQMIRVAPDFHSWATSIDFVGSDEQLIELIQVTTDDVFTRIIAARESIYLDKNALNIWYNSPRHRELLCARQELQQKSISLEPELEASLEFVFGRITDNSQERSKQHYERSLELFQTVENPQRQGYVLYYLGLWWANYVLKNREERISGFQRGKEYFQQCIQLFDRANLPQLAAKFINSLGAIVHRLQQWEELETIANQAVALHQAHPDEFRLARAYNFLTEVALAKQEPTKALQLAEQALSLLENAIAAITNPSSEQLKVLDFENYFHRGWYLYSLAKAQHQLGRESAVISTLETARDNTKPQYDPGLYIGILTLLRGAYFQQGEYLNAFNTKQKLQAIESQFGLRAFIGAGRLQPKLQVTNPALPIVESAANGWEGMAVSGREQDVTRLVERMERDDLPLTIIHGQSGVGKSSIIEAGLIPALESRFIDTRPVVVVLQQVYSDWVSRLTQNLAPESTDFVLPTEEEAKLNFVLQQLQNNGEEDLLTVLIFDQFEEFFFAAKDPQERLIFYNFLRDCLDIPFVKVIFSLREDYLHYLLECNNRLVSLDPINDDILNKQVLYYLGNFSPDDAKAVINNLIASTKLNFDTELIEQLVQDLSGELREVRPIELQIVGAQMQVEKINNLQQYQGSGSKEEFVGRFLADVITDCGTNNEQIAKLVLYLLTDENNTRPLKNRADLEMELEVQAAKLDLVLDILVKAGLVLRVPAIPEDRYQLVHDYLVPFVRQQQSERLIKELETEREQRKLTEAKLIQVQKRQLQSARRARNTFAGLVFAITGIAALVSFASVNLYFSTVSLSSSQKQGLERLVSALKVGKLHKRLSWLTLPETKLRVVTELSQAYTGVGAINELEGHSGAINSIAFSPDDKYIATASDDQTVKVWTVEGKEIHTLSGHTDSVTFVIFNAQGNRIATADKDNNIKIWDAVEGTEVKTWKGHQEMITSMSFNPQGNLLATASKDNTAKVWSIKEDSSEILTVDHDDDVTAIAFSPDGDKLATASKDGSLIVWQLNGIEVSNINIDNKIINYLIFSNNSKKIAILSSDHSDVFFNDSYRAFIQIYDTANNILIGSYSFSDLYDSEIIMRELKITFDSLAFQKNKNNKYYNSTAYVLSNNSNLWVTSSNISNKVFIKKNQVNLKTLFSYKTEKSNDIKFINGGKSIVINNDSDITKIINIDGSVLKNIQKYESQHKFHDKFHNTTVSSADNKVEIWNIDGRKLKLSQQTKGRISKIIFSPDSKIIAGVADDHSIKLWRTDGELIGSLEGHQDQVNKLYFSPDSTLIISTSNDQLIQLWDISGKLVSTLSKNNKGVSQIIFSPNSQIIAIIDQDGVAKLWKHNGTLIKNLGNDIFGIREIIFSPNSQLIAVINEGNSITILNQRGQLIKKLEGSIYRVDNLNFSGDSNRFVYTSEKLYNLYSIRLYKSNGKLEKSEYTRSSTSTEFSTNDRYLFPFGILANSVFDLNNFKEENIGDNIASNLYKFSYSDRLLAYVNDDQIVKMLDIELKESEVIDQHDGIVISLSFSNDEKLLTSINNITADNREFTTVKINRVKDKKLIKEIKANQAQISVDGSIVTSIKKNESNYQVTFDYVNGKKSQTIEGEGNSNFVISPDGKKVAVVTNQKYYLDIWNTDGSKELTITGHDGWINSVSFSQDGEIIVSASDDKTVKLWNQAGDELETLKHNDKVSLVTISPDSERIVFTSDDGQIQVWSRDGSLIKAWQGHEDKITTLKFNPNGNNFISASNDGQIKLWNRDGESFEELEGYENQNNTVGFSSNGQIIFATDNSNNIKLWNQQGNLLKNIDGVHSVDFNQYKNIITTISASPRQDKINMYLTNGFLFQETQWSGINIPGRYKNIGFITFVTGKVDTSLHPQGKKLVISTNQGIYSLTLDLDELLEKGCNHAQNYLKNNLSVKESDRTLCDDINNQE